MPMPTSRQGERLPLVTTPVPCGLTIGLSCRGMPRSVKAVSDVFAPLSGEIVEVNEALADQPEKINSDPYGEGWMVKIRMTEPSELDSLLDVGAYRDLLQSGG